MRKAAVMWIVVALVLWFGFGRSAVFANPPAYTIRTVAGNDSVLDGSLAELAPLSQAEGLAVDQRGNIYIADSGDHRVRRVSPQGIIETIAGNGLPGFHGDGGPAAASQLNAPYGLAVDRQGNLYIADLGNGRVRKVSSGGVISTVAGGGEYANSEGNDAREARLLAPRNVAVDAAGVLYVSDFEAHRVYAVSPAGKISTFAGAGKAGSSGDGFSARLALLANPAGIAFDRTGAVYIADSGNKCIRKVERGVISTVRASNGPLDLYIPTGIAIDSADNLYIADNQFDQSLKLSAAGIVTALPVGGRDLTIDIENTLYFSAGGLVKRLRSGQVSTVAGNGTYGFHGDGGNATAARLNRPTGVAVDSYGNLFIADERNHRVRRVAPDGTITTAAGTGVAGFAGDNGLAVLARLHSPVGVAVDLAGNLYIADAGNERVRRVDGTGRITTLTGSGLRGYGGDGGPAVYAELDSPSAVAVDDAGNVYIADSGNHRIRKVQPDRTIHTVAGTGTRGYSGDRGPAASATLDTPRAVAAGRSGELFIADTGNRRLRKVDQFGMIATIGGADWPFAVGLAAGASGEVHVADSSVHRVRAVSPEGVASTIAGTGEAGFSGDAGPALAARIHSPAGIAVDAAGRIYIADSANHRIRMLEPAAEISLPPATMLQFSVLNAASFREGAVAPGEIVSVWGAGIGPFQAAEGQRDGGGGAATTIGGVQVLFGGQPAPMFFAGPSQLNVQVPYAAAGKRTIEVRVLHSGQVRATAAIPVAESAPGLFTSAGGTGQALAINEDGTVNTVFNPAARGSVITLYATGEGVTDPPSIDGAPAAAPFPAPALPLWLAIAGNRSEILFAGSAPGFSGLLQINARIPEGYAPAGLLPVVLSVGGASSQAGVTISVR